MTRRQSTVWEQQRYECQQRVYWHPQPADDPGRYSATGQRPTLHHQRVDGVLPAKQMHSAKETYGAEEPPYGVSMASGGDERTPTVEQLAMITTLRKANSKMGAPGLDRFNARNRRPSAVRTRQRAHTDHASQTEARVVIPPTPRPCFLAPSVTTPLYKITVSQVLQQML